MVEDKIIEEITRVAKKVFPSNEGEVFLFGSRARGEANENSDWDILILTKDKIDSDEKFDRYISPFAEIGWYSGEEIHPINYSVEEWNQRKQTFFYYNVMKEAVKIPV